MHKSNYFVLVCFFIFITTNLQAQITITGGSNASLGSPYSSLSNAITALNAGGPLTAPVIISIPAGFIETLNSKIVLTQTGTLSNTISIQKAGAGVNPKLISYVGTDPIPSSISDGFFVLAGADYVTIDGLDLEESSLNTNATTVMEFGYGLFLNSATDGCHHNTIKNCTISLNRIQTANWLNPGFNGSTGIVSINSLFNTTGPVTPLSAQGSNSFNTFYSNTIRQCMVGFSLIGYNSASPYTLSDANNDIGGSSLSTGNTILEYGNGSTAFAAGIYLSGQYTPNCSFNTINNNLPSGVNHQGLLDGIYINGVAGNPVQCNSNLVSLNSAATTSNVIPIHVLAGPMGVNASIVIQNNTIQNTLYNTATTGSLKAILFIGNSTSVDISSNTIDNNSLSGTGAMELISLSGSPGSLYINQNMLGNNTKTAGGNFYGIHNLSLVGTSEISLNAIFSNSITNATVASQFHGIKTSSPAYSIFENSIYSNSMSLSSSATGEMNGIYFTGSGNSELIFDNVIHHLTIAGTSTSTSNLIRGIYISNSLSAGSMSDNSVYSCGYTSTTGAATINAIQRTGGVLVDIFRNKIFDMHATGTASIVNGYFFSLGSGVFNVYNNMISDLRATQATNRSAVNGMNASNVNLNAWFNTIYLNATSSSTTTFGTSCVLFSSNVTSLDLRNNILTNLSTPAQASLNVVSNGVSACLRRSNGTTSVVPANYSIQSNNNAYFSSNSGGINTKLLYAEGTTTITNPITSISALRNFMLNRDLASVQENPSFLSTVGTSGSYLHINNAIASQLESAGKNVSGVTRDFDSHIRYGNLGYPGGGFAFPTGGSAPDIGADEFAGVIADQTGPLITYTPLTGTCSTGNFIISATIIDATGIPLSGTLRPRIYFRKSTGAWVSSVGAFVSGVSTNSNWNFTLSGSLVGGFNSLDIIQYFVVAQDAFTTSNIAASPFLGFSAVNVNSISTYPSNPNSFTITNAAPVITSLTINQVSCNGLNNGSIQVNTTAVNPVYSSIPFVPSQSGNLFSNLSPQNYTITVVDAAFCSTTSVTTITQPLVLSVNISANYTSCNGSSLPTLLVTPVGGASSYTYQWYSGTSTQTTVLEAQKDNTIFENNPDNSNGIGNQLMAGASFTDAGGDAHRAFLKFNIQSVIPQDAIITNASLALRCSGYAAAGGSAAHDLSLHKMLQDWGEGTSNAIPNVNNGGFGGLAPATVGDVTWNNAFHPSTAWNTTLGGNFNSNITATTSVTTIGFYTWSSTNLTSDVQLWTANPSSNFGWILKGPETVAAKAKKFWSREADTAIYRPKLSITYQASALISTAQFISNAAAGTYLVVVTDANGCTAVSNITIGGPSSALSCSITAPPIACNGGTTTAQASVSGGSGSYNYVWYSATANTNTVNIFPSKDNTIYQGASNNSNGLGTRLVTGLSSIWPGMKTRALLRFDVNGNVPFGSHITNANLSMNCASVTGTQSAITLSLYRMLDDWGEGTSAATLIPSLGVAATTNDATWINNLYPSSNWSTTGGAYFPLSSASTIVAGPALYAWSNTRMINDLQTWLNDPSTNKGWVLRTNETGANQEKLFNSKDDVSNKPTLAITYTNNIVATTMSASNLPANTYTVVVTDALYGCTTSSVIVIGQPNALIVSGNANPNSPICAGTPITLTGIGATSYTWSNGITNAVAFTPLSTATYTVTGTDASGCTATSSISVVVNNCNATLDLTCFIQGYYLGANSMTPVLMNTGQTSNPLICDSMMVSLMDATTPSQTVWSSTVELDVNGMALMQLPPALIGNNYYIKLNHRSSLETWSANPILINLVTPYDFSTSADKAYGDNQKEMEPGVFALFSGDINQDGYIDGFDFPALDTDIFNGVAGVYVNTDLNGDGFVDGFDFPFLDINSFNGVSLMTP